MGPGAACKPGSGPPGGRGPYGYEDHVLTSPGGTPYGGMTPPIAPYGGGAPGSMPYGGGAPGSMGGPAAGIIGGAPGIGYMAGSIGAAIGVAVHCLPRQASELIPIAAVFSQQDVTSQAQLR
eukprot:3037641-Rhodomonas_salina.2